MAKNSDEIAVAGTGSIYIAPLGTTLPTNESTSLNAAFEDLGYSTEDGISFAVDQTIEDIKGWQSRDVLRRILVDRTFTANVELMQWNSDTLITAFGGGSVEALSSGHYRYDFPDDDESLDEVALILEWIDGAVTSRLVLPRVSINDATEVNLNRTSAGTFPIAFKALKPDGGLKTAYLLTNSTAFTAAS